MANKSTDHVKNTFRHLYFELLGTWCVGDNQELLSMNSCRYKTASTSDMHCLLTLLCIFNCVLFLCLRWTLVPRSITCCSDIFSTTQWRSKSTRFYQYCLASKWLQTMPTHTVTYHQLYCFKIRKVVNNGMSLILWPIYKHFLLVLWHCYNWLIWCRMVSYWSQA